MKVSTEDDNSREEVKRENIFFPSLLVANWKLIVVRERVILINYTRQGGTGANLNIKFEYRCRTCSRSMIKADKHLGILLQAKLVHDAIGYRTFLYSFLFQVGN